MCGIGFLASLPTDPSDANETDDLLRDWNRRLSAALASRGPDVPRRRHCFAPSERVARDDDASTEERSTRVGDARVTLHASVLHMRGSDPAAQPLLLPLPSASVDASGDERLCALCWNGECYTYRADDDVLSTDCGEDPDSALRGRMVELIPASTSEETSDTVLVRDLVREELAKAQESGRVEHEAIAKAMGRVHGEFSFVLHVPPASCDSDVSSRSGHVYYGRDRLGRRSLLVSKSLPGVVMVSSVAMDGLDQAWEEIPPGIVFRLNAYTGEVTPMQIPIVINKQIPSLNMQHGPNELPGCTLGTQSMESMDDAALHLLTILDSAVRRRVMQAPLQSPSSHAASVAVLFSGGIDSVVLAALSHRHVPPNQPIDLINVSFYADSCIANGSPPNSPDRLAAILSCREMIIRFPERRWRFIAVDVLYREVLDHEEHILRLISPLDSTMDFNIATAFWFAGRGMGRVLDEEDLKKGFGQKAGMCSDKPSATSQQPLLRFATGAGTAPPKRQVCSRDGCTRHAPFSGCVFQACKVCCGKFQGPISSYLGKGARLCPAHNNLNRQLKGNAVSSSDDSKCQAPNSYHAFRNGAVGCMATSSAKVLLSGVGADEQMAGYGRHRTTYQRGGYEALSIELEKEVNRLWTRNLGRDDRCLSDHGREARLPYLDEDVMAFLQSLPMEYKCDMTRPPGEGDKLILRKVARIVGVTECSTLVKRAIQFGSRIAKVSDVSRFGSSRKASGQSKINSRRG